MSRGEWWCEKEGQEEQRGEKHGGGRINKYSIFSRLIHGPSFNNQPNRDINTMFKGLMIQVNQRLARVSVSQER